jgi:hypothetical protein
MTYPVRETGLSSSAEVRGPASPGPRVTTYGTR